MQRCFQLAQNGLGKVAPNPMVGCVIVKDGRIIGEGFHIEHGGPHAEVNAIESVKDTSALKGATLYVNLEPCVHYGKTPPCSNRIIESGISKVVISGSDPNNVVMNKGIKMLEENDVVVQTGLLLDAELNLNRRFRVFHSEKRAYVILKWAQTKDGFMDKKRERGEGGQFKISGPQAKRLVHQWRSEEQAILVGSGTIINDDPLLTVREIDGKRPLRIVIDLKNEIPSNAKIFTDGKDTLVYNSSKSSKIDAVEYKRIESSDNSVPEILSDLHERGIQSLFVEGGAFTLQSFLDTTWDEARVFVSQDNIHSGLKAPHIDSEPEIKQGVGQDELYIYRSIK